MNGIYSLIDEYRNRLEIEENKSIPNLEAISFLKNKIEILKKQLR